MERMSNAHCRSASTLSRLALECGWSKEKNCQCNFDDQTYLIIGVGMKPAIFVAVLAAVLRESLGAFLDVVSVEAL